MKNNYIQHLLSAIKLALSRGQNKIIFKTKLKNINILNIMYKEGFIKSYQFFPDLIVINLKSSNSSMITNAFVELNKIKFIKKKQTIALSDLVKMQRREGGAAYYILNTDLGVITSFEAVNNNIGGKILFRIA